MFSSTKGYATQEYLKHPFSLPSIDILDQLQADDETGLDRLNAQEAQSRYGPNKLEGEGGVQWHTVLLKQISNAMILVRTSAVIYPALSATTLDAFSFYQLFNLLIDHTGPGARYGIILRSHRLHRRRCHYRSHCLKRRHRVLSGVSSREENGISASRVWLQSELTANSF